MKSAFVGLALAVSGAAAADDKCSSAYAAAGVSDRYAETIAHAVHSLTVQDLRQFKADVTAQNGIPTVPHNLTTVDGSVPDIAHDAPDTPLPEGFDTDAMRTIDLVLSHIGAHDDGLGDIWSNLERVVGVVVSVLPGNNFLFGYAGVLVAA